MPTRTKHYIVSEVAALLGCDAGKVYTYLKEGKLRGHKTGSGKWLIPIDQEEAFDALKVEQPQQEQPKPQPPVEVSFTRYIADQDHCNELINRILAVRHSLKMSAFNFEDFKMYLENASGPFEARFYEILQTLVQRGVKVQIIGLKPVGLYVRCQEKYPELLESPNFELRQCDRVHMKVFIFDEECAYIGSANLTDAAIGQRPTKPRNHEAGILAQNNEISAAALRHFDAVWDDPNVVKSSWKRFKSKVNEYKKNIR